MELQPTHGVRPRWVRARIAGYLVVFGVVAASMVAPAFAASVGSAGSNDKFRCSVGIDPTDRVAGTYTWAIVSLCYFDQASNPFAYTSNETAVAAGFNDPATGYRLPPDRYYNGSSWSTCTDAPVSDSSTT